MTAASTGLPPANSAAPAGRVVLTRSGPVATATLDNPARRNAVGEAMWTELQAFALAVGSDPQIRVVVFRGADRLFSAGADISGFAAARGDRDAARAYDDRLELACRAVEAIRQPTVARLSGPVVGGGAALAASCDLLVAADDAFFMIPAARLGLGYDPRAIARLVGKFGEATVRWLLLTAGRLPAARAHQVGAVHEIVPAERLDAALDQMVATLLANAPLTQAAAKVAVRAVADGAEPTLMDEAWRLVDAADASADYAEGRAAFAAKRPPRFQGR